MPIKPELRYFYPIDWPELSRAIRFGRAKGRCERCARPHGQTISHLGDGRWFDAEREIWRDGQGREVAWVAWGDYPTTGVMRTKVFLAAAHMDHDPTNNRSRNFESALPALPSSP